MVTTITTSAFTAIASQSFEFNPKSRTKIGESQNHVNKRGIKLKADVQIPSKENSANTMKTENHEVAPLMLSSSMTTFKPLLELDKLFGSITKGLTKGRNQQADDQMGTDSFCTGELVQNGLVYREKFPIRSYEIGAHGTVSIETLLNHSQETGLNHLKVTGLLGDGLGSTPEMYKRKLIWVSTKTQIVVDRYPTWGDTIQVENWFDIFGKNSLRRDSVTRDSKSGDILVRATSNFVMMNKETRRLCRFPDEVREEMSPFCKDAPLNLEDDCRKLLKLDDTTFEYMCPGIKPIWSDLDINQHVNNAKYIGWILESAPVSTLKSHKLSRMTLEYKRECQKDNVLQSTTTVSSSYVAHLLYPDNIECHHSLKLEDGAEIMKARTEWVPK